MNRGQFITGFGLIVVGIFIIVGFFRLRQDIGFMPALVSGLFFLILGIIILFNPDEDILNIMKNIPGLREV